MTPEILNQILGIVVVVLGIFGIRFYNKAKTNSKFTLPETFKRYYKLVGDYNIMQYIKEAASFEHMTNPQKKFYVRTKIVSLLKQFNVTIPDSYLNLAIEYAFNRFKESQNGDKR